MSDIDPAALTKHRAPASGGQARFGAMTAPAVTTAAPDGNETLAWLAGNRMPDRRKGLQAPAGASSVRADAALRQIRPSDPIEAAQKRASILADLNRDSPNDPRVKSVFDADPIIVEDPRNGNLVTRQMLNARLEVMDLTLSLIGKPALPRGAHSRAIVTLKTAYAMLDNDAQVEWTRSEVRLAEVQAFLADRPRTDLDTLGRQLLSEFERHDLWTAARTLSMAAHMTVGQAQGSAALADLLEMREL